MAMTAQAAADQMRYFYTKTTGGTHTSMHKKEEKWF
jgi:hypothetical protein